MGLEVPGAAGPARPVLVIAASHEADELVRELERMGAPLVRLDLREATPGRVLAESPAALVLAVSARGPDPLCRAVRATAAGATLPILLVGSFGSSAEATLAGGDAHVGRPVDGLQLRRQLAALLGQRAMQGPPRPPRPEPPIPRRDEPTRRASETQPAVPVALLDPIPAAPTREITQVLPPPRSAPVEHEPDPYPRVEPARSRVPTPLQVPSWPVEGRGGTDLPAWREVTAILPVDRVRAPVVETVDEAVSSEPHDDETNFAGLNDDGGELSFDGGAEPGEEGDDLPELGMEMPPPVDVPEATTFVRQLRQTFYDIERRLFPDQPTPAQAPQPATLEEIDLDALDLGHELAPFPEVADTYTPYSSDEYPVLERGRWRGREEGERRPLPLGGALPPVPVGGPRTEEGPLPVAPLPPETRAEITDPMGLEPALDAPPDEPVAAGPSVTAVRHPGPPLDLEGPPGAVPLFRGTSVTTMQTMLALTGVGAPKTLVAGGTAITGVIASGAATAILSPAVLASARDPEPSGDPEDALGATGTFDTVEPPRPGGRPVRVAVDLPVLLHRAFRTARTGRLVITRAEAEKAIWLERGVPVFATSNVAYDRMGDLLYREGKITRRQWEQSCELVAHSGRRMGAVLVDQGFLKPKELFPTVRRHIEEILYSVFDWAQGSWRFEDGGPAAEERIRLAAPPGALILEGIRRKLGRELLVRRLGLRRGPGGLEAVVTRAHGEGYELSQLELLPDELELLDRVDGEVSLGELLTGLALDEPAALQALYGLSVVGFIRVLPSGFLESRAGAELVPGGPGGGTGDGDQVIDQERLRERHRRVQDADYFALLGVRRDASEYEIRRAYQQAKDAVSPKAVSPGLFQTLRRELAEIDAVLDEAYDLLKDAHLREQYRTHLVD